MHRLLHIIKTALGYLWDYRFSMLIRQSQEAARSGLSAEEAYRRGYSEGYWDGTTDLIGVLQEHELLLLQLSHRHCIAAPLPATWQPLTDEVH